MTKPNGAYGDPECKLGVQRGAKRSTNQQLPDGTTQEKKELIWGYGTGVAAATTPDYGDIVLAEHTLPFNEGDVTRRTSTLPPSCCRTG